MRLLQRRVPYPNCGCVPVDEASSEEETHLVTSKDAEKPTNQKDVSKTPVEQLRFTALQGDRELHRIGPGQA